MSTKTLGVMRNKSHLLYKYKEDQKQQMNRFKKSNDLQITKNALLLDGRSAETTASNYSIEMHAIAKSLPQEWGIHYEDTRDKIGQVKEIIKEIQLLATKRIKMQFGDASQIERAIYENNSKATQKIMECEKNIELISNITEQSNESDSDRVIRLNIQRALAQQIQEISNQLRNQQKRMVTIIKSIHNDDGVDFLKLSAQKQVEMAAPENELTQAEEQLYDQFVEERDQEINRLVSMINDLADVFKSLNQLVVDQGTILDRIDYNIDSTLHNVRKANVELKKAEEYQNSPMARRCIAILLGLIVVFSVILTIKYTH